MVPTNILLDSNAYFRLARSIHPLLNQEFGDTKRYRLYVIADLEKEFARSRRLQNKFSWVDAQEYRDNRACKIQISRKEQKVIKQTYDYIANHARSEGLGTSYVDIMALVTAHVLDIQIVTDDQDMLALADAFGIATSTTLGLMHLMLDTKHIEMDVVRQICEYWQYERDIPANFRRDYSTLFGEEPPPPF